MNRASLMFQFSDETQARLASDTLMELGYEPQMHEGGRLHIHVENEDLTSALEIVQCYAGQLLERAPAESAEVTDLAYGMDDIRIPAHTVNEDWVDAYRANNDSDGEIRQGKFKPDDGSYDSFSAT
ncbi:hypothetical protein [Cohnella soli]|uniref:DUF2007 domain-containing protein n=1 Tax=Cohnella soli TaxID=425005 RepID=A0ABW0HUC4_9BACL